MGLRVHAVVAVGVALVSGCAIRYDAAGTSRVGIGLWGFGDPPGVNWNLDWPRTEVPELPSMRPAEPPEWPRSRPTPVDGSGGQTRDGAEGPGPAIDDNRCRAFQCDALAPSSAVCLRADAGGVRAARI
jgi:hypothetical protein